MTRATRVLVLFAALWLAVPPTAAATQVEEHPVEHQLRELAQTLRCPVCQGENVYDSRSPLAGEMRAIMREQLLAGRTADEIIAFFVQRYGDFVRLEPGRRGPQLVIWLVPGLLLLAGAAGVTWRICRRARPAPRQGGKA